MGNELVIDGEFSVEHALHFFTEERKINFDTAVRIVEAIKKLDGALTSAGYGYVLKLLPRMIIVDENQTALPFDNTDKKE